MHSLALSPIPVAEPLSQRPHPPDLEAVHEVIRGNREMFEVIVRRYNVQLYRIGMAYLRNHAQAEDAMQEAYLKAFLHLDRFREKSSFATWLTRIMINECLMILRTRKRATMEIFDETTAGNGQDPAMPAPFEPLQRQDLKILLEAAIQTLSRSHRAVYMLREVQRLSTAETAECLGMTRANVKVSLHRAREELKAELLKSAAGVELFDYPAVHCDPMTARVMAAITQTPSAPAA